MDLGRQGAFTFPNLSDRMGHVAQPDADWRRLGRLVTRRREDLNLTQGAVQAAGGPSVATMRIIESAGKADTPDNEIQTSYRRSSLNQLENALGWARGSVDAILGGGDPIPLGAARVRNVEVNELTEAEDQLQALKRELKAIRDNPDRSLALQMMARSQLEMVRAQLRQIEVLRDAIQAEDELASRRERRNAV